MLALRVLATDSRSNKKGTHTVSLFCWCGRRELNPYGKTTRPSNVRVCQFRHSRRTLCIITYYFVTVNRFLKYFFVIFCFLKEFCCSFMVLYVFYPLQDCFLKKFVGWNRYFLFLHGIDFFCFAIDKTVYLC